VGSGFGFGLGAFLTSFLPLSLLPMAASVPQKSGLGEGENTEFQAFRAILYPNAALRHEPVSLCVSHKGNGLRGWGIL
jgi:hypothetical protein